MTAVRDWVTDVIKLQEAYSALLSGEVQYTPHNEEKAIGWFIYLYQYDKQTVLDIATGELSLSQIKQLCERRVEKLRVMHILKNSLTKYNVPLEDLYEIVENLDKNAVTYVGLDNI